MFVALVGVSYWFTQYSRPLAVLSFVSLWKSKVFFHIWLVFLPVLLVKWPCKVKPEAIGFTGIRAHLRWSQAQV